MRVACTRIFVVLTASIFTGISFAPGQTSQWVEPSAIGLSAEKLESITQYLNAEVQAGRIPGAVVLIARHGRVGYFQAVGHRDLAHGLPMRTDTLFRIASMTKAVTSVGVMMLVEDGRIALDDPLSKYVPGFQGPRVLVDPNGTSMATRPAAREPTIHDLVTHTSGITYGWFGPSKLDALYRDRGLPDLFIPIDETIGDRVQRLADVPLKSDPGTAWDYGLSLDVLGRVIEVASGLTLEQFFHERIFRPLKMTDTFFYVPDDKLERLAALYTVDASQSLLEVRDVSVTAGFLRFTADYCHAGGRRFFSGGGGLVSSAADYARFLSMLLHRGRLDGVRVLQSRTVADMTRNRIGELTIPFSGHGDRFGFGFGILTDRGAGDDVASTGTFSWGGIFNTYFWVDPQEEMVGLLMTQVFPNGHLTIREQFKRMAYAAIDDSGFERVYWYEKGLEHGNPFFNQRQLRVNAPEASIHETFAARSEARSAGLARIRIDEDLRSIRRARLYCELWGGHPGTANKRMVVNGRASHAFPEVGTADGHCTHQYHTFNLSVTDLVNGFNALQFACDQGVTFWGHYIVDNAALRIGVDRSDDQIQGAGLADVRYAVVATPRAGDEGFTLRLRGSADRLSAISRVDYQARYTGYDENGNGWRTDWHGMTRERIAYGQIGSSTSPPFSVDWDTRMIPAQKDVAVRAQVEFKDARNLVYTTPPRADLEITKPSGVHVTLVHASDLPPRFWSRAGHPKTCTIDIPIDPRNILAAALHVVAWTGGAGSVGEYFRINRHAFPIAEDDNHRVEYSRIEFEPSILRKGPIRVELLSDTSHHGIEILLPGPAIAIRHRSEASAFTPSENIGRDLTPDDLVAFERFALTHDGNPAEGERLFLDEKVTKCAVCHKVDGRGGTVGPDLSSIGGKFDRPHLIESLLAPSAQIVEGYRTSTVLTARGEALTGIVRHTSNDSIRLVDAEGSERTLAMKDIERLAEHPISLMPDGLQETLSHSQFTDLIAYLETLRAGHKTTPGSQILGGISIPEGFALETVATGLTGCTAMETTADGRVFLCEQTGALRVIENGKLLEQPFLTLPVDHNWERGLIGLTVHPDFPDTPFVYVCYVAKDPFPHHRISRFTADGNQAKPDSERVLLTGDDQRTLGGHVPAGHQGGGVHFGPDGNLYIGIGEQTAKHPSQKLDTFQGKLLRIRPDGSIPDDNPFVNEARGKYQAIWALGLRNPFTFAFRERDGTLLINDVGGKFEEINPGRRGANYGWPTVEHGPTTDARFVSPIHHYPQASIGGGDYVEGFDGWPDRFYGRYFFADFVHGWIKTLNPEQPEDVETFASGLRRPVDLRFARDGSLYVLLRNAWVIDKRFEPGTGTLLRIRYSADDDDTSERGPAPVVRLIRDTVDESADNLPAYRIETPEAVYYLEKTGAGLSSLLDRDGNDWLSFHPRPGSGAAGEYRGFPNAVFKQKGSYFHARNAGTQPSRTRVVRESREHVTIEAESDNGLWACSYDFYPDHATFTMKRMPDDVGYWVLYEGTPGGSYEDDDWWMTSSVSERQPLTQPHEGDIPAPEWIAFGDRSGRRSLLLLHHQDDSQPDRFYQMRHEMTVFGFGREGMKRLLRTVPRQFSIRFVESTDHATLSSEAAKLLQPAEFSPSAR